MERASKSTWHILLGSLEDAALRLELRGQRGFVPYRGTQAGRSGRCGRQLRGAHHLSSQETPPGPPPPMHASGVWLSRQHLPHPLEQWATWLMPTPCPAPPPTAVTSDTPSAFREGGTHGLGTGAGGRCCLVLWAGALGWAQAEAGNTGSQEWGPQHPAPSGEGQCGDGLSPS